MSETLPTQKDQPAKPAHRFGTFLGVYTPSILTILAVVTGTLTYLAVMFLLGMSTKIGGESLAQLNPNAPPVWKEVAFLGLWLVLPGMWGAILSSAFGSALSGPRVLQALARDGLAPKALARTSSTGQPTVATWVTGAMALAAVDLGDLNSVGRWVTIFFSPFTS